MSTLTHILNAIDAGDPRAAEQLLPLVYDELRRLAARKLAQEKPGQTLDATALVHEAYLRLTASLGRKSGEDIANSGLESGEKSWSGRSHFFAAAAEAMRRILIDNARRKKSEKRGGLRQRIDWNENLETPKKATDDLLAIDEAITVLEADDAESAHLVKLRFYAGLSVEEAADAMGLSRAGAYRVWAYAKAWLRARLGEEVK